MIIILGSNNERATKGFALIGHGLTLIYLTSITITNISVNTGRPTTQALFAEVAYVSQFWLLWIAPIASAIVSGLIRKTLFEKE